jgi:plastocyanin
MLIFAISSRIQMCDDSILILNSKIKNWEGHTAMLLKRAIILLFLSLTVGLAGCGKHEEAVETAAGPVYKPTGEEGSVTGVVNLTGDAPAPKKLDTGSDAKCGEVVLDDVVANNGKLQNVFVYVKSGAPQAAFAAPAAEVTLDQKGCRFSPRILGLQTGQVVSILNSDQTNHNVHPIPKVNKEWNESQLAGQSPIRRKFTKQETLIPVKCNQHSWMTAYIGVLSHPFFAVSDAAGLFTIKGLPPGEYELEAWHEKYGAKSLKITVAPKIDAKAEFNYNAAVAYTPGTLKTAPAIVLH